MKIVFAWLCMVTLAVLAAGSCSIKHQSERYECDTTADCAELGNGRVCSEGLCVVPGGGGGKDAATDALRGDGSIDAAVCPSQCTSCSLAKKECVVDCQLSPQLCAGQMTCPLGYTCTYKCNTGGSCRNGVNCQMAVGCHVECSGNFACRGVTCGPGPCNISCTGSDSCSNISCGASCACDVTCNGNASCSSVTCTSLACNTGRGCSSQFFGCETCP